MLFRIKINKTSASKAYHILHKKAIAKSRSAKNGTALIFQFYYPSGTTGVEGLGVSGVEEEPGAVADV